MGDVATEALLEPMGALCDTKSRKEIVEIRFQVHSSMEVTKQKKYTSHRRLNLNRTARFQREKREIRTRTSSALRERISPSYQKSRRPFSFCLISKHVTRREMGANRESALQSRPRREKVTGVAESKCTLMASVKSSSDESILFFRFTGFEGGDLDAEPPPPPK